MLFRGKAKAHIRSMHSSMLPTSSYNVVKLSGQGVDQKEYPAAEPGSGPTANHPPGLQAGPGRAVPDSGFGGNWLGTLQSWPSVRTLLWCLFLNFLDCGHRFM